MTASLVNRINQHSARRRQVRIGAPKPKRPPAAAAHAHSPAQSSSNPSPDLGGMDGIDWSGAGDEGAAASQAAGAVPMDLDLDSALTPLEAQEDEAEDASATGAPPVLDDEDSDDDGWPRAFLEGFEASDNEDSGVEKDAGGGGSSASADTTPSHFAGVDGRAEVEGYRGTRDEGWSSPQAEVTNKDWTLAAFRQLFLEAHLTETAYNSLCNIVLNPKFTPSALALCTTAKTLRTKFAPIPTRTIYSHLVPTSVTSKSSGVVAQGSSRAYWYSVQDTIEHHLLQSRTLPILPPSPTPQDEPGLHQGLARSPAIKEEFYEGTLWQESIIAARPEYPLFAGKGGARVWPGRLVNYIQEKTDLLRADPNAIGRVIGIFRDEDGEVAAVVQPAVLPAALAHTITQLSLSLPNATPPSLANFATSSKLKKTLPRRVLAAELREVVKLADVAICESAAVWKEEKNCSKLPKNINTIIDTILVHGRLRRPSSRSLSLLPAHRLETTLAEDEIANGSIDIENLPPADERPSEVAIVLSVFHDKFGVYRTTHRSSGGCYVTCCNMASRDRDELRNRIVLGFTPFGASFSDAAKPSLQECERLAREGFEAEVNGKVQRVFVKILTGRFDSPEANEEAGIMGPTAEIGCPRDEIPRSRFGDMQLSAGDLQGARRQPQAMAAIRAHASTLSGTAKSSLLSRHGLRAEGDPFSAAGLAFNPHRQILVEPFHSEAGIVKDRLLPLVFKIVSSQGRVDLGKALSSAPGSPPFALPSSYPNLQNPHHLGSYTHHEALALLSELPYLLRHVLAIRPDRGISRTAIAELSKDEAFGVEMRDPLSVLHLLIQLCEEWARSIVLSSSRGLTDDQLVEMEELSRSSRQMLLEVYQPFAGSLKSDLTRLPNMHIGLHLAESASAVGSARNCSVAADEQRHRECKRLVPHSNNREMDLVFMKDDNIRQGVRWALEGRSSAALTAELRVLREDIPSLFSSIMYAGSSPERLNEAVVQKRRRDGYFSTPVGNEIVDIHLIGRPSPPPSLDFPSKFFSAPSSRSSSLPLFSIEALRLAYAHYYTTQTLSDPTSWKVSYYRKIVYTDLRIGRRVSLSQGEITQLDDGDASRFARVEAILSHRTFRTNKSSAHVFLVVTWLRAQGRSEWGLGRVQELVEEKSAGVGRMVGLGALATEPPVHVHSGFAPDEASPSGYDCISEFTISLA